ncbi:hypothetical protein, partial [Enterobacter hormaechei]
PRNFNQRVSLGRNDLLIRTFPKMLGLGSSDEITVSNVNGAQPDALGGQKLSYRATTEKGRIFDCSSMMMPGILGSAPTLSAPTCTPVVTHK